MTTLKGAELSPIDGVPGLFISDLFAARSIQTLKAHNVQYVLSITRTEDKPSFNTAMPISTMHIDIDDDPTEDLLFNLKSACDWIENSLNKKVGVLVHCTQGISRCGAVIVAYLMRPFSLSFPAALAKARETRPLISPNIGFEYQLRIWDECGYDVFDEEQKEKTRYLNWISERDRVFSQNIEDFQNVREEWIKMMEVRYIEM